MCGCSLYASFNFAVCLKIFIIKRWEEKILRVALGQVRLGAVPCWAWRNNHKFVSRQGLETKGFNGTNDANKDGHGVWAWGPAPLVRCVLGSPWPLERLTRLCGPLACHSSWSERSWALGRNRPVKADAWRPAACRPPRGKGAPAATPGRARRGSCTCPLTLFPVWLCSVFF